MKLLLYILRAAVTKDKSKHVWRPTKTAWGVRVFFVKQKWVKQRCIVCVCLRAAKSSRSGGTCHRMKYYLQLSSCVSPASNAVLSVVLSVMPIFRRPCFHEIKRHIIAPRVNSTADWTILEAEKLFTACKWPSVRPSHRKTNHASSSLAVSIGGGGQGETFHLHIAMSQHTDLYGIQAPKRLHYVYEFGVIINSNKETGQLTFILTARFICFRCKSRTYTILRLLRYGIYPYVTLQALCPAHEKAVVN